MIPMHDILVESVSSLPVGRHEMEYVERKGVGHPDSICDAVMESISIALCQEYLNTTGRVLHHNIDKGMLIAGQTTPKFGGGTVDSPMRLVVGDRATDYFGGHRFAVKDIVAATARQWFSDHLRFVEPDRHVVLQHELRPGSAELVGIFSSDQMVANDTSAAVGYAPLTETEHLVFAAEHFLNSAEFKHQFPETGEDVKVMGIRYGRQLQLTVAVAFVDHYIWEELTYYHRKDAVRHELRRHLESKLHELDSVQIEMNMLDVEGRGLDGMYLTVLGTSAECGDSGEVGRGNRVNGLISLSRPMPMEAAAGKNPTSHVGKIYNLLAHQIADRIYSSLDAVQEAHVWLCSRIGQPLDEPWFASAQVALAAGAELSDIEVPARGIIQDELASVPSFVQRLSRGELSVC